MHTEVELTTVPGLEDVAVDELRAALPGVEVQATPKPEGMAGHVRVAADHPDLAAVVRRLRSAQRVVRPVARFPLPAEAPLDAVRSTLAAVAPTLPELAPPDARFRVRCKRVGEHPFTSEDVERIGGAGVRDGVARGVQLTGDAVVLRCDVRGPTCLVGVELPAVARPPLPWRPTTSLKPALAWGLLALARPFDGPAPTHLLDPFCGGGTVLTEAAARWPAVALAGSDLHARCVDGVAQNLAEVGAGARSTVRVGDARALEGVWPDQRFDTIVTNPPFGERLGKDLDLEAFYRAFLQAAARVATPDARLVVLALRRGAFNRALRAAGGWETRHVRIVELGGLYAGAFVLAPA